MATAPASLPPGNWARFVVWLRSSVGLVCVGVIFPLFVAAISMWFGSYIQRNDNIERAVVAQNLVDLRQVKASGKALDRSADQFYNALISRVNVDAEREELRAALSDHAADVLSNRAVLGPKSNIYLEDLGRLSEMLDGVTLPENSTIFAQKSLDALSERTRLIQQAEEQATKKS